MSTKNLRKNQRIFITGGTGFIGNYLSQEFKKAGFSVYILSRKKVDIRGFKIILGDLTKERDLLRIKRKINNFQFIIHAAATMPNPNYYFQDFLNDIIATLNLCKILPQTLKRLIYLSSIAVYGDPIKLPLIENHPTLPTNLYGANKLICELILKHFLNDKLTIFRLTQVYGPNEKEIKAIPKFINACLKDKRATIFGDGRERRDYIFVADIAKACFLALSEDRGSTFNIASGKSHTILQICNLITNLTGTKKPIFKKRQKEKINLDVDASLAKAVLGFKPRVSIKDGLLKEIDFFKKQLKI